MEFDLKLPARIADATDAARIAEAVGFNGAWSSESTTDAMLLLAAPSMATKRIRLGTNILVALARSPFVVAQSAWELQRCTDGRFVLGVGTQVPAHLRHRFSVASNQLAARLEEYVAALRALWNAFQTGEPISFEGRFYSHTLLSPTFDPGPIRVPDIPLHLAAVNEGAAERVGRVGDGLLVHPMHTVGYVRDVLLPAVVRGAVGAGREPGDIDVLVPPFIVPARTRDEAEAYERARATLAFHGATRAYAPVLKYAGFPGLPKRLNAVHKSEGPEAARRLVPDALVDEFVVRAEVSEALMAAAERYEGLATRILAPSPSLAGDRFLVPDR